MWRIIGPALLFSGAAIGTSHLVQSTRAGAVYGLALVGVIALVCLLKYPAFRFGVDYGHSTRRSLLVGYREMGRWAPILFAVATLLVMPVLYSALSLATAGIAIAVFGVDIATPVLAIALFVATGAVLLLGGYSWLDKINRVLVAFLVVSTLIVTAMVLPNASWGTLGDIGWAADPKAILFVVALAGFMPNPLDVSVSMSMWTAEAERLEGEDAHIGLADARTAFLSGYAMTGILAICFCIIGAGVMHADAIVPESSAPGFAKQIIGLYEATLGEGAAILASIAALSVMATTLLAALDIGARNGASVWQVVMERSVTSGSRQTYTIVLILLVAATGITLFTLSGSFTALLDLATSLSLVIAPMIAALNHRVVTRGDMPDEARPSPAMRALNLTAIAVMACLAGLYFAL